MQESSDHGVIRPIPGWEPNATPIGPAELPDVLAEHEVVLIHFWASWNGYDRVVDERIHHLLPEFNGAVASFACNFDDANNHKICSDWNVTNVPTIVAFRHGEKRKVVVGVRSRHELRQIVAEILGFE